MIARRYRCVTCGKTSIAGGTSAGAAEALAVCCGQPMHRIASRPSHLLNEAGEEVCACTFADSQAGRHCGAVSLEKECGLVEVTQAALEADRVNHPLHYGGADAVHEVIKCLKAWGLERGPRADSLLWNAVKYIARAGVKTADPLEDLKKAAFYLNRRVAELEAERGR